MVILADSAIDSVVRGLRWLVGSGVVVVVIDDDSGCTAVNAVLVEERWGDGTPNACALGKALYNAMTARRVDAIIFIFSTYDFEW